MMLAPPNDPSVVQIPREHIQQLRQIDQTYWWHRIRWRVVRDCIHRYRGGKAFACYLDVGTGGGGLPALLGREFTFDQLLLVDQFPLPTDRVYPARQVERLTVNLESFQWEGIPTPDLITCLDVLEHLSHPEHLLESLGKACRTSHPLLIITVPAMPELWSSWDVALGHYRRYRKNELKQLLSRTGWHVVHCSYLFAGAVLPVYLERKILKPQSTETKVPLLLSPWINTLTESLFWFEYCITRRLPIPLGSSLLAVAVC